MRPSFASKRSLDARADHLLARDAVGLLGEGADQVDAAAGDDEGLEAVRAQIAEQLDLRPVGALLEQPAELRVPRRGKPVARDAVELFLGHPGMGRRTAISNAPACRARAMRLQVALQERLEGLPLPQRRVLGGERLEPVDARRRAAPAAAARTTACRRCRRSAMRSAGRTKSGPPSVVTRATKSRIADFAMPSFQDGSGPLLMRSPSSSNRPGQEQVHAGDAEGSNLSLRLKLSRRCDFPPCELLFRATVHTKIPQRLNHPQPSNNVLLARWYLRDTERRRRFLSGGTCGLRSHAKRRQRFGRTVLQ